MGRLAGRDVLFHLHTATISTIDMAKKAPPSDFLAAGQAGVSLHPLTILRLKAAAGTSPLLRFLVQARRVRFSDVQTVPKSTFLRSTPERSLILSLLPEISARYSTL